MSNFEDGRPRPGFSTVFSVAGLPSELKVSFWIWFIGGFLGLLGGLLGMLASLTLFAAAPGAALGVLLLMLLAATVGTAQIIFAWRMKEGKQWARLALTVLTAVALALALANLVMRVGQGGNWAGFLISLAATVLLWLPRSQAWFAAASSRRGNSAGNS
jgi:glucose-6-phosphate-specific signal transduction histidine kinase